MKSARSWLASLVMIVASGLANASFSYSFTGPSILEVGQIGSFNFQTHYTPIDVSLRPTDGGVLEWSNFDFYSTTRFSLYENGSFVEYLAPSISISGGKNPYTGVVSGLVDPRVALDLGITFTRQFLGAGNFSIIADTRNQETIFNQPSEACRSGALASNSRCFSPLIGAPPSGAMTDVSIIPSGSSDSVVFSVSTVPENDTMLMMIVGVALLGFLKRRHDNKELR